MMGNARVWGLTVQWEAEAEWRTKSSLCVELSGPFAFRALTRAGPGPAHCQQGNPTSHMVGMAWAPRHVH